MTDNFGTTDLELGSSQGASDVFGAGSDMLAGTGIVGGALSTILGFAQLATAPDPKKPEVDKTIDPILYSELDRVKRKRENLRTGTLYNAMISDVKEVAAEHTKGISKSGNVGGFDKQMRKVGALGNLLVEKTQAMESVYDREFMGIEKLISGRKQEIRDQELGLSAHEFASDLAQKTQTEQDAWGNIMSGVTKLGSGISAASVNAAANKTTESNAEKKVVDEITPPNSISASISKDKSDISFLDDDLLPDEIKLEKAREKNLWEILQSLD